MVEVPLGGKRSTAARLDGHAPGPQDGTGL
jgi:hypothetical protein